MFKYVNTLDVVYYILLILTVIGPDISYLLNKLNLQHTVTVEITLKIFYLFN